MIGERRHGALLLVVVVRMREGRSWARTALAVVGAIAVLVGVLTVGETFALFGVGPLGAVVALLRLATAALAGCAVLYMFSPAAAAHFAAPKR